MLPLTKTEAGSDFHVGGCTVSSGGARTASLHSTHCAHYAHRPVCLDRDREAPECQAASEALGLCTGLLSLMCWRRGILHGSALAMVQALLGREEGLQFGRSGGFRDSETENLTLGGERVALDLQAWGRAVFTVEPQDARALKESTAAGDSRRVCDHRWGVRGRRHWKNTVDRGQVSRLTHQGNFP